MGRNLTTRTAPVRPGPLDTAAGLLALLAAVALVRHRTTEQNRRLVARLKRRTTATATTAEAERLWSAVHLAKRALWVRAACLESSLALVLLAVAHRLSVDWCVGVALAPFEAHAWAEAEGGPVQEPDGVTRYSRLFTA